MHAGFIITIKFPVPCVTETGSGINNCSTLIFCPITETETKNKNEMNKPFLI